MKTRHRILTLLLATPVLPASLPAAHASDAGHGAKVFAVECAVCHSAKQGMNKMGPSLFGIAGHPAASVPDYVYSAALKDSGLTWTTDKLDAYLTAPRKLVPGCKMGYEGLHDATARADLIAFMQNTH